MTTTFPLYLFVYGTLQSGLSNARHMYNCQFVGKGKTIEKFALYVDDYPFVTRKNEITQISGEIYLISDQQTLDRLDRFESHPTWYYRDICLVVKESSGETIQAHLYFNENMDIEKASVELVSSGDYRLSSQVINRTWLKEEDDLDSPPAGRK